MTGILPNEKHWNPDEDPYIIMPGAFGSEPKTVPLVRYDKDGKRHVIGEAAVHPDGIVESRFDDDTLSTL